MARDVLDCAHALVGRDVREHDAADDVADSPHAVGVGVEVLVDDEPPPLELHAGLLRAEALGVGRAADRQQHLVRVDGAALAAGREPHLQRATVLRNLRDPGLRVHDSAEAVEVLQVRAHEVGVDHRQHLGQHLEHRHLRSERREHRGEFHADDAASDHGEPLRDLLQLEDAVRVDRQLGALQRDAGDRGAGGDDHVLDVDRLIADRHLAAAGQPRRALERGHATCFEQALDALDELIDDRRLPLLRRHPVEAEVSGDEAERLARPGERVELRRLEQRLGRDAAAHEAGAAHAVLLDDRGGRTELSGAERGHVAAGPAADNQHIKGRGHQPPLYELQAEIISMRPCRSGCSGS